MLAAMAGTCNKEKTVEQPAAAAPAGVTLSADGPGNTYELVASVLGGDPWRTPIVRIHLLAATCGKNLMPHWEKTFLFLPFM